MTGTKTHHHWRLGVKSLDSQLVLGTSKNITFSHLRTDINYQSISICKNEWRNSVMTHTHEQGIIFVKQSPNPEMRRLLYIFGVSIGLALLLTALIYLLLGIGLLKSIPTYVIWAIILFSIGAGILSGMNTRT
ncbi:MAG: hypothetical protein MET45_14855 [Nostoc sp. LLA-1]|nr:hypothetical protein [Cyanocohniella sp. LLY]